MLRDFTSTNPAVRVLVPRQHVSNRRVRYSWHSTRVGHLTGSPTAAVVTLPTPHTEISSIATFGSMVPTVLNTMRVAGGMGARSGAQS
jgi:hypothetical protein